MRRPPQAGPSTHAGGTPVETFGKYQVLEQVGEGGFGRVYRGFDPVLKREVAIKTCHLHSPDLKERFIREAEIAASLRHPGIVTVFDFGEENGVPYLVQEFLTGEDLEHMVERGEPAGLDHRVWILRQAGEALQYAHAQGVVHRDVKPANIRVEADGSVRLMDFGIAKLVQTDRKLTQMGFSLGTVGYLSPEQLLGREVDHRADVFSFGVLAYEVLTGRKPFEGDSVTAVLYAIAHADPAPLDAVVPGVPRRLSGVVERCLRKDVGERFQHMGRVVEELDGVLQELRGGGAAVGAGASAAAAPTPPVAPPLAAPREAAGVAAREGGGGGWGGRRAAVALTVGALAVAALGIVNLASFSRGEEGGGERVPGAQAAAGAGVGAGTVAGAGDVSLPADPGGDPPGGAPADEPAGGTNSDPAGAVGAAPVDQRDGGDPTGGASAAPKTPLEAPATASAGAAPQGNTPAVPPAVALDAGRLVLVGAAGDAGWDRAEAALVEAFLRAGVRVPDPASLDGARSGGAARGDVAAVQGLARSHGAATLLVATLRTGVEPSVGGFFTGSAELVLRRYDGLSGELLEMETVRVGAGGVPGKLGPTPEGALGDAAAEAGTRGAALVLRRIR